MNDKEFSDKEIFDIALKARDFEIRMFWQRCNYFLLLNTSVGVGAGTAAVHYNALAFLGLCVIGMVVCFAWIRVGLGSKYWQSHWEWVVDRMQKNVGLTESKNFFSDHPNVRKRVRKWLEKKPKEEDGEEDIGRPNFYNSCVLEKPSVSGWMHRTACFFFVVWVVAAIISAGYVLFCLCEAFLAICILLFLLIIIADRYFSFINPPTD